MWRVSDFKIFLEKYTFVSYRLTKKSTLLVISKKNPPTRLDGGIIN